MSIKKIAFQQFEKQLSDSGKSFKEYLAPELGRTYVVSITRDNCPACAKQKPQLKKLAKTLIGKHKDKLIFAQIHISMIDGSNEESLRSKSLLGHYFYPTNFILFRTRDRGAIEGYRNISPRMTELKRNIEAIVKTSDALAEAK